MTTRYSKYQKRWLYDRARGINRSCVDAAVVRAHIAALQSAGVKLTAISNVTGCAKATIRGIAAGRTQGCQQDVARRILAVTRASVLAQANPRSHVPVVGAARRIRALQAIGHTFASIEAVAGVNVRQYADPTARSMTQDAHQRICLAYEALSMKPGPSKHNRTWAIRHGWAPPLAWDDDTIDDPTATPVKAKVANPTGGPVGPDIEDIELLASTGMSWAGAASRLGTKRKTLERRLIRLGRFDLTRKFYRNSETYSMRDRRTA